jgi:FixJ family two-component response regulator
MADVNSTAFTVFVVDDDEGVLRGLSRLLRTYGYSNKAYSSAQAFLDEHDASVPGCVVLDLSMPGMNGLDVQHQLIQRGIERTIIFLTGAGTVDASIQALKAGALDFLLKPFKDGRTVELNQIRGTTRQYQVAKGRRTESHKQTN